MTIDANLITGMEIGGGVGFILGFGLYKLIEWINNQ
jgi:hypothetical protein